MELKEAIFKRATVRKFLDKDIKKEHLEMIVNAGNHAPSACDIQGWRFIVIKDTKVKDKIADAGAPLFIKDAPVGIVVAYDNRTENLEYKDYIQSAAACMQNMILMAYSLKIGCCWVCHLPNKSEMRKILDIPLVYEPIAYIAMGYFRQTPKPKLRKKSAKELISYNKFDFNEEVSSGGFKLFLKRLFRKIYYALPGRKILRPAADKFEKKFD